MTRFVLDASALLAHVLEEPGWKIVDRHLHGALMSTVNYSEVLKKVVERGGEARIAAALVSRNQIELENFDAKHAAISAELWATNKERGLSFADRACLSHGMAASATVLTADRRMAESDVPVSVIFIREGH